VNEVDAVRGLPHSLHEKINVVSSLKYIVVVTTIIINELMRIPAKPLCFWVFDQSLVNPLCVLIGYGDEIPEVQVAPVRVSLFHSGQIMKPEMRVLLPPIESVLGYIKIKRIPNAGKDGFASLTLWDVVTKGMLIADFVITIFPKRDSYSMPPLQSMQPPSKRAWAEDFSQGFFRERSASLGEMHEYKVGSYDHKRCVRYEAARAIDAPPSLLFQIQEESLGKRGSSG
jgi:hypothetical protein